MDEGMDVKRSGYAEVTKMNGMAAEALGYGRVGATGMSGRGTLSSPSWTVL